MERTHTCGEIQYTNKEGRLVHSDLCFDGELTEEDKDFLMANFKEFLDNVKPGDPVGLFYWGDSRVITEELM